MFEKLAYIRRLIGEFDLNLNGLNVLTEVASGNYLFPPFMAALAGCKTVYAIAKDNRYGTAEQSIANGKALAEKLQLHNIRFSRACTDDMLASCDIVTNMAALRPFNARMIGLLPSTAVISYMFETWEYRREDVDLEACGARNILAMGTNENQSSLRLIDETNKYAVLKALLDNGFSLYDDKYLLVSMNRTLLPIVNFFEQNNISCDVIDTQAPDAYSIYSKLNRLDAYDAIIILDIASGKSIIGEDGILPLSLFASLDRVVPVIHFAGAVSNTALRMPQIRWIPDIIAKDGYMSLSIDSVGFKPALKLIFAGIKAGEIMARLRRSGISCAEIIALQNEDSLLQAFPREVLNYEY